jgi:hypothetical protein
VMKIRGYLRGKRCEVSSQVGVVRIYEDAGSPAQAVNQESWRRRILEAINVVVRKLQGCAFIR